MDTIFALASGAGKAGVAVVRVSGPMAKSAMSDFMSTVPSQRGLRRLHRRDGVLLDHALILSFEKDHSFTGEDVVELHLHGSPAIVQALLSEFQGHESLRPAEAGEFTRRALENGRLDLAQVEGLADLIDAETEAQRLQAIRVFDGQLGAVVEVWRDKLIRAAALIEASIDFADEDIPEDVVPEVRGLVDALRRDLTHEISGVEVAERIRDGFEVAIVGPPNVGKSTLLNYLAGREAAITSDIAGTTRDVIEVRMDLSGLPVTFLDTAGIRETGDVVEKLGVDRALKRALQADLRVLLVDESGDVIMEPMEQDLVRVGKCDEPGRELDGISGRTGAGVKELVDEIVEVLGGRASGVGLAMRARHRDALGQAVTHLDEVSTLLDTHAGFDLIASSLRVAITSLDSLVGRVDVEDLLDNIFSSFCIGK